MERGCSGSWQRFILSPFTSNSLSGTALSAVVLNRFGSLLARRRPFRTHFAKVIFPGVETPGFVLWPFQGRLKAGVVRLGSPPERIVGGHCLLPRHAKSARGLAHSKTLPRSGELFVGAGCCILLAVARVFPPALNITVCADAYRSNGTPAVARMRKRMRGPESDFSFTTSFSPPAGVRGAPYLPTWVEGFPSMTSGPPELRKPAAGV